MRLNKKNEPIGLVNQGVVGPREARGRPPFRTEQRVATHRGSGDAANMLSKPPSSNMSCKWSPRSSP